jgi:hypothetical protein
MTVDLDFRVCCIKGCDRPSLALGLCVNHWRRNRLYGSPVALKNHSGTLRGLTVEQRFDAMVKKVDGCWGWRGAVDNHGYARMRAKFDGVEYRTAHRLSYVLHTGEHPGDLSVLHQCDNPKCTNPDHLFLGTTADNMADKIAKGRGRVPKGEDAHNVVLTEPQVREIFSDPRPYAAIATEYGVHTQTISDIKNGYTWKHIDAEVVKGKRTSPRRGVSDKITPEIVLEIRASAEPGKVLAERYGVSTPTISNIRKRRSWAHVT